MPITYKIEHFPKPENKGWHICLAMTPEGLVYDYANMGSGTPAEVYHRKHLGLPLTLDVRLFEDELEFWLGQYSPMLNLILAERQEFGEWTPLALQTAEKLREAFEKVDHFSHYWNPEDFFSDTESCLYEMVNSSSLYSYCEEQLERAMREANSLLDLPETFKFFEEVWANLHEGATLYFDPPAQVDSLISRMREKGMSIGFYVEHEEWDAILFYNGEDWSLAYLPDIEDALDLFESKPMTWAQACLETKFTPRLDKEEELAVLALALRFRDANYTRGEENLLRLCDALGITVALRKP
jgi:hypothetical protein